MKILTHCPMCGKSATVEVPDDELAAWQAGQLIQNAMPSVSAAVREQLVTGVDDACWQKIWSADEDV